MSSYGGWCLRNRCRGVRELIDCIFCCFAVLDDFFFYGFAVSYRPQCPPPWTLDFLLHGSPALYNLSLANGDRIFGQMKNCGKPWKGRGGGVGDWLVFSIRVSLQSSALIWLATLLVIRLQTELDDTKSCYQLIKTMTKFGKEIKYRLYVFTKNNDNNNNSLLGEMRDNSVRTWYVLSTYTGMTCWLSL